MIPLSPHVQLLIVAVIVLVCAAYSVRVVVKRLLGRPLCGRPSRPCDGCTPVRRKTVGVDPPVVIRTRGGERPPAP
jgi:hypothetical protein